MKEELNYKAWTDPRIVDSYAAADGLTAAETAALDRVRDRCKGGKILDVGVGAGRTTAALRALSKDYQGVDYSEAMVALCRLKFPDVDFACRDARDLAALPEARFDLVVFSFNGIDYASHQDRGRILAGIARLLKSGGEFLFSTHNRSMEGFDNFPLPLPPLTWRIWELVPGFARLAAGLARHAANKRLEVRADGYAIINEPECGYALLTYYVTIEEQKRQLREAGFRGAVEVFNKEGRIVAAAPEERTLHFRAAK